MTPWRLHWLYWASLFLNVICNITQFVVIVPVPGSKSVFITKYFMQNIQLKFSLYSLIVINQSTIFKLALTTTCDVLKLLFKCAAKRNHKSFLVRKLNQF